MERKFFYNNQQNPDFEAENYKFDNYWRMLQILDNVRQLEQAKLISSISPEIRNTAVGSDIDEVEPNK